MLSKKCMCWCFIHYCVLTLPWTANKTSFLHILAARLNCRSVARTRVNLGASCQWGATVESRATIKQWNTQTDTFTLLPAVHNVHQSTCMFHLSVSMIYEENILFMDVYTSSNMRRNSINKLNSFYPKYVGQDEGTFSLEKTPKVYL